MMIVSKIAAFLDRYPGWVRLRAGHLRYDHQPALIGTRTREEDFDAQAYADSLLCELQHHCDQFDSDQRYQLVVTDEHNELLGLHVVTLSTHRPCPAALVASPHGAASGSDDPEIVRLALRQTSESQRHAENCVNLVLRCNQAMLGQMSGHMMRLEERCKHLEDRHWQTMDLAESMASQRHQREIETAEATRRAGFQERMFGKFAEVVPYLIGAVTGATPVAELLQTLTPDKLQMLSAVLSPRQLELFADLATKAHRADIAKQIILGQRAPELATNDAQVATPGDANPQQQLALTTQGAA